MTDPAFTEFRTLEELHAAAAARVLHCGREALAVRGRFHLVLAGGNTPRALYAELARRANDLEWALVDFWWGDERCVPRDHAASNFKMAWDAWLSGAGLTDARVHRIRAELELPVAAKDYESQLLTEFGAQGPAFDLVLLGLGSDGHSASLFPDLAVQPGQWVVGVSHAPKSPPERVSLSEKAFAAARNRLFLVTGEDKAQALEGIRRRTDAPGSRIAWAAPSEIYWNSGSTGV